MRIAFQPQEQWLFRATGDGCLVGNCSRHCSTSCIPAVVAVAFLAAILPLGPAPTACSALIGDGEAGQFVSAFIFRYAAVAFHPYPFYIVR